MIIIAESGGTKTDWRSMSGDGTVRAVQTVGMNPSCMDMEQCQSVVRDAVPTLNPEGKRVEAVYFYGAGLVSDEACAPIRYALEMWCPFADVQFHSDLLAAARALFGDGSGVVAIMGTGSNSCMYQNGVIAGNIRPGGFILGDEGSGAALGKSFISDYIKGLVPADIDEEFKASYGLDYPKIVQKVYREPGASAFLASFAPFLVERMAHPYVQTLVDECMDSFMKRSLSRYEEKKVGVVGSFGCACEARLKEMGTRYGIELVRFLKSPIDELVAYHSVNR